MLCPENGLFCFVLVVFVLGCSSPTGVFLIQDFSENEFRFSAVLLHFVVDCYANVCNLMNWVGIGLSILWLCGQNLLKFFIDNVYSEMGFDDSSYSCAQSMSGHQF